MPGQRLPLQVQELDALKLLGICSSILAVMAVSLLYFGRDLGVWTLAVAAVSIVTTVLVWLLQRRGQRPGHVQLVRGLLVGAGAIQAGLWSYLLAFMVVIDPLLLALYTLALILALAPALYWYPGLVLLASGLMLLMLPLLSGMARWWFGLAALVMLVSGWLFNRVLRENARLRSRDARNVARLEDWESRCLDMEARLLYERESHKTAKKALAEARDLAEDGSRIKTEFLATISHEIRTPLNGILPILEMMQGTSLTEEQRRFVRAASSSSQHLLRIINDLLDFARADSGKLRLESIELKLDELLHSVMDLMAGSAESKGLRLKTRIQKGTTLSVQGDPVRLRQILANLISNAIKFTEQGGIEVGIEQTGAAGREVDIRFSVRDTGIGLSSSEARGLFSSFSQADASTTRKFGGTGLGLAICRRLVELMGGRIGVRSALGQGSTFWFVLPMRRSLEDLPSTRTSLEDIRTISSISEDRLESRLSDSLGQWGMQDTAVEFDQILRRLRDAAMLGRSKAFECLLLDKADGDKDLDSLFREVRRDPLVRRIPIVLLDHSPEAKDGLPTELPHQDSGVHILPGPYRPESLRQLLNRIFDVSVGAGWTRYVDEASAYFDLNVERDSISLPEDAVSATSGQARPRILLVEDNPVNLGVVKRVLKRLGAACLVAENGQQALEILYSGERVDAVLMDCQMPVMDGFEATRLWREYEKTIGGHLPIIAMTANVMPGDEERCRASGMDDYLGKPVGISSLARALSRWTGRLQGEEGVQAKPGVAPSQEWSKNYLDRNVIEELHEVMQEEFREIICSFLENSPDLVDTLEIARDEDDCKAAVMAAHALKSSSANMGASQLSSLASVIETAARQGDCDVARQRFAELVSVFNATCTVLRMELGADADRE